MSRDSSKQHFRSEKLDTKSGYLNFDTMEKADAKKKTDFGTLRPFKPTFSSEYDLTFEVIAVSSGAEVEEGSK